MQRRRFVVKISGSVFDPVLGGSGGLIKDVADQLRRIKEELAADIVAVAGGGKTARAYIRTGRELNGTEYQLDELGILASRANAQLLMIALGDHACPKIIQDANEAFLSTDRHCIAVAGGFQPGQSTNAVAAVIAEALRANLFINATNVDWVYNKDPSIHPEAKKYTSIPIGELEKIILGKETRAGKYELLDIVAVKILARSKTPAIITSYRNIYKAAKGEPVGTRIVY